MTIYYRLIVGDSGENIRFNSHFTLVTLIIGYKLMRLLRTTWSKELFTEHCFLQICGLSTLNLCFYTWNWICARTAKKVQSKWLTVDSIFAKEARGSVSSTVVYLHIAVLRLSSDSHQRFFSHRNFFSTTFSHVCWVLWCRNVVWLRMGWNHSKPEYYRVGRGVNVQGFCYCLTWLTKAPSISSHLPSVNPRWPEKVKILSRSLHWMRV